jgi:hypothetical protein
MLNRKTGPMERKEQPNSPPNLQQSAGYEPPKVMRVSLRPEEAVLGHCKVSGQAGPVSASCRGAVTCRSIGS